MKDRKIFTENFSGSIDDLLAFTQENANFVEDVHEGRDDVYLNDEEAIKVVKEDYKELYNTELTDSEATELFNVIKQEMTQDVIDKLVNDNLVEVKEYDEDGNPLYGLTEKGEELYKKINNKNET